MGQAAPTAVDQLAQVGGNVVEFTVSEISQALKRTLEDGYGHVRIRGEISGFKRASSGHLYFSLKDAGACLDGVCWRGNAQRLGFQPEDGLEVVVTGRITTFPGRSKYQVVVEQMAPAGLGALMALLEERKQRLATEGLFAAERKPALPFMPRVIGVVTSPTGAVIRDILHRLAERFPCHVLIWPVLVQGEQAAGQIAAAIEGFCALPPAGPVSRPDLLIVARGGGSLEDLWPFNEEIVVRAAAACTIPLISAVGHETDTTLIDLAAAQRAPTPTAAAELAVPVRLDLLQQVGQLGGRLLIGTERGMRDRSRTLAATARALPDPVGLLGQASQRLDDLVDRLGHAPAARLRQAALSLAEVGARLGSPKHLLHAARLRLRGPEQQLRQLCVAQLRQSRQSLAQLDRRMSPHLLAERMPPCRDRLRDLASRQEHAFDRQLRTAQERLKNNASMLTTLSYQGVLARGFALVRDRNGQLITSASEACQAQALDLQFADDRVEALVVQTASQPATAKRADAVSGKTKKSVATRQGRLL